MLEVRLLITGKIRRVDAHDSDQQMLGWTGCESEKVWLQPPFTPVAVEKQPAPLLLRWLDSPVDIIGARWFGGHHQQMSSNVSFTELPPPLGDVQITYETRETDPRLILLAGSL